MSHWPMTGARYAITTSSPAIPFPRLVTVIVYVRFPELPSVAIVAEAAAAAAAAAAASSVVTDFTLSSNSVNEKTAVY